MKKIAVLIADNIYNRKGMMNAELNRISHLKKIASYSIDVFAFQNYSGWPLNMIKRTEKRDKPSCVCIDGIDINVKWRKFSVIDYILTVKLNLDPVINKNWTHQYISEFKDYDIIVANSTDLGFFAMKIHQTYHIPFYVTWHGTDIHTSPFANQSLFNKTKQVLEAAEMNFMVSKALQKTSTSISSQAKTRVLYNGVSNQFYRFSDEERNLLRKEKKVVDKKVVAFAGHLIEVKNPQLLPEIFNAVNKKYNAPIEFWVMGTGKKSSYIIDKCKEYCVPLKMWGNIPADEMPKMLNCVDVQVLPSRNEGLPLIAVEALACGANAVGARVGGIPEAMGEENTFIHGSCFIEDISNRIVYMLQNKVQQPLMPYFSWEKTAEIENDIYLEILK